MIEPVEFKFAEPADPCPLTEEELRRQEENLRWLERHCDFEPFGSVW